MPFVRSVVSAVAASIIMSLVAACQPVESPVVDVPVEKGIKHKAKTSAGKSEPQEQAAADAESLSPADPPADADAWYIGTKPDEPFDIPLVDRSRIDPQFRRVTLSADENEPANTIIVDIDNRQLTYYPGDGSAIRYGIGVGRRGFSWRGNAQVGRKSVWPDWTPTKTMREVIPNLPEGMAGGLDSPLGARALYLYQNGQDILFRIHGTNEPWTIGEQVSSGCVRMLNEDVADLYDRVAIGAKVIVHNSKYTTAQAN
jgi:lipoprotein-anchoring transpeptidase ErfK/SrfK